MHQDSRFDTAAARNRSLHGRTQVTRPEDLVWPPPLEDLQAFSVIKVGEDDERAASMLIVAGVAATARPQPKVAAPVPSWPRNAVRPSDVVPPPPPIASPALALRRWTWLGLLAAALDVLF